jgi:hypothetical protein
MLKLLDETMFDAVGNPNIAPLSHVAVFDQFPFATAQRNAIL